MTSYLKRRGRRSLAAILAAMLMASVLAVVAGAPAQAANTSGEALVDSNGDGVPDAREFGGRDRYDTANRLAANFGKAEGLGAVPVAFVASGFMLVDAISVAGLAGFLDAPVLLTPSESLNGGVADFIEDYGVQTIHVLGGSAAVSDSVVEAIEGLANKPTVSRIFGADRYATAAAVASNLGGGAAWCGGAEAAAILANGGDVSLAYAMAISPVANRLQLPLLLTAADELPSATEDFITDQDIEHVVIMGGESSVSDDVSAALTSAGVDTVTRIDGDTAAAASAALADLSTDGCKADLGLVSDNTVALVAASGLPDGVAASPVLASSYQNGSLVPMLIVGDTLPASVSDYLASTPTLSGTNKRHLNIVAIGGDAAVSSSVMEAALMSAASAGPLTAQITSSDKDKAPQPTDTSVVLRFSDNIIADATPDADPSAGDLTNLIRDNLMINGVPVRLADGDSIDRADGDGGSCAPDAVTVSLASPLKAGDVISLAGGAKFGAGMDQRTVAATSVTVPAAPRDTTAPVVSVVAIDATATGVADVALVRFDTDGLDPANNNNTIEATEIVITSTTAKVASNTGSLTNNGTITVNDGDGTATTLAAGDRITIKSGALVDMAGNKSRARTFTMLAAQASPRITAVTMSELKHTGQARAVLPDDLSGATQNVPTTANFDGITISAKKGGAADGAVGNGWTFRFDRATSWKPDAKAAVDIDVHVSAKDRLISVRFNTGNAKFADLKAALEADSAFDAMFMVNLPAGDSGVCGATANEPLLIDPAGTPAAFARGDTASTSGGTTAVAIEVRFNAYAATVAIDTTLADDVFTQVRTRYNAVAHNADGTERTDLGETGLAAAIGGLTGTDLVKRLVGPNAAGTPGSDEPLAAITGPASGAPETSVRYELETGDPSLLPMARDLVNTAAGNDATSAAAGYVPPADRTPAVPLAAPVATGYAADAPGTTTAREDYNAASQVRISQSSNVKAPAFAPAS